MPHISFSSKRSIFSHRGHKTTPTILLMDKQRDVHHGNYNPSCKAKSNMQEDSYGPMTRDMVELFLTLEGCSNYKYSIRICNKQLLAKI
jgi:hypothetical protein